ncbi:hypothetical protein AAVH_40041, partial [Aphelenchoides avenae]
PAHNADPESEAESESGTRCAHNECPRGRPRVPGLGLGLEVHTMRGHVLEDVLEDGFEVEFGLEVGFKIF